MRPKTKKISQSASSHSKEYYYIYGKHASSCALANPKRNIVQIFVTNNTFADMKEAIGGRQYKIVSNEEIGNMLNPHEVHQGILIKTTSTELHGIKELPANVTNIAILDQITDPHNIGAIMRSAAAFNIDALIVPDMNTPSHNGIIAKIASGGLEHVSTIRVKNLTNAIEELKKQGFWVVGLDGKAKASSIPTSLAEDKIAIVLGSEGKGMRKLTQKNCDLMVKIPMSDNIESLNVSNAAAIMFQQIYLVHKQ